MEKIIALIDTEINKLQKEINELETAKAKLLDVLKDEEIGDYLREEE